LVLFDIVILVRLWRR